MVSRLPQQDELDAIRIASSALGLDDVASDNVTMCEIKHIASKEYHRIITVRNPRDTQRQAHIDLSWPIGNVDLTFHGHGRHNFWIQYSTIRKRARLGSYGTSKGRWAK